MFGDHFRSEVDEGEILLTITYDDLRIYGFNKTSRVNSIFFTVYCHVNLSLPIFMNVLDYLNTFY